MIKIFTDGGCYPNPGNGGWAVIVCQDGQPDIELYGGERDTTNNRMEMMAFIKALEHLGETRTKVTITTDSQYVKNGVTTWIYGWRRRGWLTADGKEVKNQDLWMRLHDLAQMHDLEVEWTKGHAGHHHNERCDVLATQGRKEL